MDIESGGVQQGRAVTPRPELEDYTGHWPRVGVFTWLGSGERRAGAGRGGAGIKHIKSYISGEH